MSHDTDDCDDPEIGLYISCPECDEVIELRGTNIEGQISTPVQSPPQTESKQGKKSAPLRAKNVEVRLQKAKFERTISANELLNRHESRLEELIENQQALQSRLNDLESIVQISLGRECPDCGGVLRLTKSGLLQCQECGEAYPDRPGLHDREY